MSEPRDVRFDPERETVGNVPPRATIDELSECAGVYAASPAFAVEHSGPLVARILKGVPASYFEECCERGLLPNIDVRIHRLYPGIFPAFPGWHCDGEFRESYFSQPDLERTPVSKTIVCTISSHDDGVSRTEFLDEPFTATVVGGDDQSLWRQVHEQVEATRRASPMRTWTMPDGYLTLFSNNTLHRAMPTMRRGWRLFFRMSMWHRPYLAVEGKVSRQEQVYQVLESLGW